jgi:hypothetical protein
MVMWKKGMQVGTMKHRVLEEVFVESLYLSVGPERVLVLVAVSDYLDYSDCPLGSLTFKGLTF